MSWIEKYAEERSARDSDFKAIYEADSALLSLIRARNAAKLSQKDVAEALQVSQPYIAAVENGSKPMSLSLMVRYANAVGASIIIKQPSKRANKKTEAATPRSGRPRPHEAA